MPTATLAPQCALKGWHSGERAIQEIIHLPERVSIKAIVNRLPEQHRIFHTSRLHFLPTTTLDDQGRPWASMLCSKDGEPAYISSPCDTSLIINARVWDGDPAIDNLHRFKERSSKTNVLVSALGIEVSTRRRNKFAGSVSDVSFDGADMCLQLTVNQALGLCPKYINVRTITPYPDASPQLVYQQLSMNDYDRLPDEVIEFIHSADTAYLGTSYVAPPEDERMYPSHVSTNHRGGRPGFVRVRPSDGRTIVLPNYAGNRMMNSLGNIYVTPLAGLVFPSFSSGAILYVTGTARTLFGQDAQRLMPAANVITTIRVTGFAYVENALPMREAVEPTRSPYSPPVRYLAEEKPPAASYEDVILSLLRVNIHNDTLATFTFNTSRPIEVKPSQNAVLELSELLRVRSHEFLEWEEGPSTENDDCVRTWTVSTNPTPISPCTMSLTIRTISGGLITPILYKIVDDHAAKGARGVDIDVTPLNITARLRGIGGDLPVPEPIAACDGGRRLLWIAGGIGLTPFLSLARYVAGLVKQTFGVWDIVLVLSTREPDVMLGLISDSLEELGSTDELPTPLDLSFVIHMFAPGSLEKPSTLPPFVSLITHKGRLDDKGELFSRLDAKHREPHICGPLPFVTSAMKSLNIAGVDSEHVRRERFTY
ncbi:hypothetical protein SERLA73DRAFT_57616 [Serpula lacrymans var. lacrymans S7.3]|uniref:Ferric reductase NAD binding domain-containing protein n=1 Tax=Serpula lacrymans var. lacrymans (strain S7.3) TaxID=936435 RepID=F8Q3M5_SERL3|nr:hypothetical protein SERLA73DRAFT_57616 [Serpula lacrymans var. lacrymans S7.3]